MPLGMSEEVLSLVLGAPAEVYGMRGTVVVAVEASQAVAVVQPLRSLALAALDVVYGAYAGADAAPKASVLVYVEVLVGDEMVQEERPYYPAVDAWPPPYVWSAADGPPRYDVVYDVRERVVGIAYFLSFAFGGVNIHERQSDVRLWHYHRCGGIEVNAFSAEVIGEDAQRLPDVVTGRAYGVCVVPHGVGDAEPLYELPHYNRRTPPMYGEHETEPLSLIEHNGWYISVGGDAHEPVACGFGYLAGYPQAVACG